MLVTVSAVLLIMAVVYFATAWYTKMVNVSDLTFNVAQWEFSANNMIDSLVLDVYEYDTLEIGYIAPGSAGFIPVDISVADANTSINYYITLDASGMSETMQQRMQFYYLTNAEDDTDEDPFKDATDIYPEEPPEETTDATTSTTTWTMKVGTTKTDVTKTMLEETDSTQTALNGALVDTVIAGDLEYDEETERVYIYWEWIYEFVPDEVDVEDLLDGTITEWSVEKFGIEDPADVDDDGTEDETGTGAAWAAQLDGWQTEYADSETTTDEQAALVTTVQAAITDLNNEYDTAIGKDPTLYKDELEAILTFTGEETRPVIESST